ncbi:MAG: hypothetical protein MUF04_15020 [Akkermansiaceae bacterium]|nr:hypothetical protein [Akkermansiaceae bacterium]
MAQYSTNLSNWADALDNDTTIIVTEFDEFYGAGVDKVEVKLSRSLAVGGKLFVRLSAAQN